MTPTLTCLAHLAIACLAVACAAPLATHAPSLAHERFTLPSGMDVILHPDPSSPLVAVSMWYHVGSGVEQPGRSGFAHLFEHIMFQGSLHTGPGAHFNVLRNAGASVINGTTDTERTNYYQVVPPNALELALWLESDRMGWLLPALTLTSLDIQREVVRNERRQRMDNVPYGKEEFAVAAALYPPGHPYRYLTIGRHEDLEAASLDDVSRFLRRWYVPSNATLTLAGDIDPEQARRLVVKWFGDFPRAERPMVPAVPLPEATTPVVVTVRDRLAGLRRLHLAWHGPALFTPGDADLDLLAHALAVSGGGRLRMALMGDHRLAHDVRVHQESQTGVSEFHVVIDLQPGAKAAQVKSVTEDVLAAVRNGLLSKAELARAVTEFEVNFVWNLESVAARAKQLQAYRHHLGDPDRLQWDLDRYRQATPESVREAARKWLDPSRRVEVWTEPAPADTPAPDLAPEPTPAVIRDDTTPPALAFPDAAFRKQAPALAPPALLKSPVPTTARLRNGLQVVVVERPMLPTVAFTLVLRGGSSLDPPGRTGLAKTCMGLLGYGSRDLYGPARKARLDELGADMHTWTTRDQMGVSGRVLVQNLDATLELLADLVVRPGLPMSGLEGAVRFGKTELERSRGDPQAVAERLGAHVAFGRDHPYGRLPTAATYDALTIGDCRTFWSTYGRPRQAQLFVVGRVRTPELIDTLEERLQGWLGLPPPVAALPLPRPLGPERVYLAHVPGAQQAIIQVVHQGPARSADDWAATTLGAAILAGGFPSRINTLLRERRGLTYGVSGRFDYDRIASHFAVTASVRTDGTGEALREIIREMADFRIGDASSAELWREKRGIVLGLADRMATSHAVLGSLVELAYHGLPWHECDAWPARYGRLKAADVRAAMASHLRPGDARILVVGDQGVVGPLVEAALREGALGLPPGGVRRLGFDGTGLE